MSLVPILLAAIAGVALYQSPYAAGNLDIVPDSTEFALAAHRFSEVGDFKILVGGDWLPPRYAPWFPVSLLSPSYALLGPEIGNAIAPITLLGVLSVLVAYAIGKRLGDVWGGSLAALTVLALPGFRRYAKHIMSDVPNTFLALTACWVFLHLTGKEKAAWGDYLLAGTLVASGFLYRPVSIFLVIPFIWFLISRRGDGSVVANFVALCAPLAVGVMASLAYNSVVFGSPFRTGYHFWTSVPYDYRDLTFSFSYLPENLSVLWRSSTIHLVVLALVSTFFLRRRLGQASRGGGTTAKYLEIFLILGLFPGVIFYLFYFYPSARFHLSVMTLSAIVVGGAMGRLLIKTPTGVLAGILVLALTGAGYARSVEPKPLSEKAEAIEAIVEHTPDGAWVISSVEPAYIEYFVAKDSRRTVIPLSRHVEYAGKLITPTRVENPVPRPTKWAQHRHPGVRKGGAYDAIPKVASESLDLIVEKVSSGIEVYIDLSYQKPIDSGVIEKIRSRLNLRPVSHSLFKLEAVDAAARGDRPALPGES